MAFLTKIKRLFKKTVEAGRNSDNQVVSLSKTTGKITLNKFLLVPQGFAALLVAKERVCDKFTEGEHKLSLNNLPLSTRILKLNIPNKKGKSKTFFKADVYFVNLKEFKNQKFKSINGVYIKKDKEFLGFYVNIVGTYSYQVSDPELLLEALLNTHGIIRNNVAQRQIDNWTAVCAEKKIEKNRPSAEQIYERETVCFNGVIDSLNRQLSDIGIKHTSFEVTETLLPKRIYKKVQLSFGENIEEQRGKTSTSLVKKTEPSLNVKSNLKIKQEKNSEIPQQDGLIPYENNLFEGQDGESGREVVLNQTSENIQPVSSPTFSDGDMSAYRKIEKQGYLIDKIMTDSHAESTEIKAEADVIDKAEMPYQYEDEYEMTAESQEKPEKTEVETGNKTNKTAQKNAEEITVRRKVGYKTCSACGAVNTKSAKKCFKCNGFFVKNCEKCGEKIKEGEFVCPKCKSVVI